MDGQSDQTQRSTRAEGADGVDEATREFIHREVERELQVRRRGDRGATMLAAMFAALLAIVALLAAVIKTDTRGGPSEVAAVTRSTVQPPAPSSASITIDHVTQGCHAWSVNGGTPSPNATLRVAQGGTLVVTNDDVMPHMLQLSAGPQAQLAAPNMNHMGATSKVRFQKAGVYRFTTKAGEDYMPGVQTVGPDNTLSLQVIVS